MHSRAFAEYMLLLVAAVAFTELLSVTLQTFQDQGFSRLRVSTEDQETGWPISPPCRRSKTWSVREKRQPEAVIMRNASRGRQRLFCWLFENNKYQQIIYIHRPSEQASSKLIRMSERKWPVGTCHLLQDKVQVL